MTKNVSLHLADALFERGAPRVDHHALEIFLGILEGIASEGHALQIWSDSDNVVHLKMSTPAEQAVELKASSLGECFLALVQGPSSVFRLKQEGDLAYTRHLALAQSIFDEGPWQYGEAERETAIHFLADGICAGRQKERADLVASLRNPRTLIEDEDGAPYPESFLRDVALQIEAGDLL